MIDKLLATTAPHPCYGCGKLGALLCDNCKYDIISEQAACCIVCGRPAGDGICKTCNAPYQRAWYVGERSGELRRLIDEYKFESKRGAGQTLAELLSSRIDVLPETTRLVPVPTLATHIRERGFDHTLHIAKKLSKIRKLQVATAVYRVSKSTQKGASRSMRLLQAEVAFAARGNIDISAPHLLIDDVITTGATVRHAAQTLKNAGVKEVWVAVIARQPLD